MQVHLLGPGRRIRQAPWDSDVQPFDYKVLTLLFPLLVVIYLEMTRVLVVNYLEMTRVDSYQESEIDVVRKKQKHKTSLIYQLVEYRHQQSKWSVINNCVL